MNRILMSEDGEYRYVYIRSDSKENLDNIKLMFIVNGFKEDDDQKDDECSLIMKKMK